MTDIPGHPHLRKAAHAHLQEQSATHADLLAMDAELFGGYLVGAVEWAAELYARTPRLVVDAGTGTGPGALALAGRFPDAAVVAVDRSRQMLNRLEAAARQQGLDGQISVVQADLDDGWPVREEADLVWASSALHELADPRQTLRAIHAALVPGGLLLVVEMDSLPRFLPHDPAVPAGLEHRLHHALNRAGWNHHPDWRPVLEQAGFQIVGQRTFSAAAGASAPLAGQFADGYLRRMKSSVAALLPASDLAALNLLLDQHNPASLLRRPDLTVRSSRTAWATRRALHDPPQTSSRDAREP